MKIAFVTLAFSVCFAAQESVSKPRPRIYVTDSNSWTLSGSFAASNGKGGGTVSGGAAPQTVEIIKNFNQHCPAVTVTIDRTKARFIVLFDHEGDKGAALRRNKISVFGSDGDIVYSGSTRSLGNAVKDACDAISKTPEVK
jgi:hypothetical protein